VKLNQLQLADVSLLSERYSVETNSSYGRSFISCLETFISAGLTDTSTNSSVSLFTSSSNAVACSINLLVCMELNNCMIAII